MHPNGELPACEWTFSDVNPPVHAWAAWRIYKIEARIRGKADRYFLVRVFHKLLLNFTWWVNRKNPERQKRLLLRADSAGSRQYRHVRPESQELGPGELHRQSGQHQLDGHVTFDIMLAMATELARRRPGLSEDVGEQVFRALHLHLRGP